MTHFVKVVGNWTFGANIPINDHTRPLLIILSLYTPLLDAFVIFCHIVASRAKPEVSLRNYAELAIIRQIVPKLVILGYN